MLIYSLHARNPMKFKEHVTQARKMMDAFNKKFREWSNATAAGDLERAERLKQELKTSPETEEMYWMYEHDFAMTIRGDAYRTGSYDENIVIKRINNLFPGSDLGERIKTLLLDPSTNNKYVKAITDVYDATEMYPKMALYFAKKAEYGGDREKALQSVLMAFPTYYNLHELWNMFDQVSPYTKYMLNWPKMVMYALNQKPIDTPVMAAITNLIPALSWRAYDGTEKDAEWFQENGFMYMGFNQAWYYKSANPFSVPTKAFDGSMDFVDPTFLWEVVTNGGVLPDFWPLTPVKK
jgi:hypothetical protein